MLVLSRKVRETIVIDGRITVKVLQVKGSTVRLGIEAPKEISIRRGELDRDSPQPACTAEEEETSLKLEIIADLPPAVSYTCAAS